MGIIVAIGGGEIGRPGYEIETEIIDKRIVELSGKKNPKLLFVPTASGDHSGYVEVVKKYYGEKLGCDVDTLFLLDNSLSYEGIRDKIFDSDIIYVGGGNTLKMLNVWKEKKVDVLFREAYNKGIVLSGISAGAICWFKEGLSDSIDYKLDEDSMNFSIIKGLGFANGLYCPHFDVEVERPLALEKLLIDRDSIGVAFDNCCAIEINDGNYRILRSKNSARAYRIYYKEDVYRKEEIKELEGDYNDLLKIE